MTLSTHEFVELENLLAIVEEHEGQVLPIGRHANLCQWLYEHGHGYYHNDKEEAKRVARRLLDGKSPDEDYAGKYGL